MSYNELDDEDTNDDVDLPEDEDLGDDVDDDDDSGDQSDKSDKSEQQNNPDNPQQEKTGGQNGKQSKDRTKKITDKLKKQQKEQTKRAAKKLAEKKAKEAAAKATSKSLSALAPILPYICIAILIILAILMIIGIIMSFTMGTSMLLGKVKKFVRGVWATASGFFTGDELTPNISDDDVKDLANYIQSMGYDIQGYGFGDVEYDENDALKDEDLVDSKGNSIKNEVDVINSDSQDIKKIYGIQSDAQETLSEDGDEAFKIAGSFSSKNSAYLLAYLSASSATYSEAHWSVKGFTKEVWEGLTDGVKKVFGVDDDVKEDLSNGVKSHSTGLLNITNEGGNTIFNSTINSSPVQIKIDPENQKMTIYEKALSLGIFKVQWGKTFSIDLSNWTAIYGRPLELFLALHISTMMPDVPYQIAVDQAFNTKVNVQLQKVNINFNTTIVVDGKNITFGEIDFPDTERQEHQEDNLDKLVDFFLDNMLDPRGSNEIWSYVKRTRIDKAALISMLGNEEEAKIYRRCVFEAFEDQVESFTTTVDNVVYWASADGGAQRRVGDQLINFRTVLVKADGIYRKRKLNADLLNRVESGDLLGAIWDCLIDQLSNIVDNIRAIISDVGAWINNLIATVESYVGLFFGWLDGYVDVIRLPVKGRILNKLADIILEPYSDEKGAWNHYIWYDPPGEATRESMLNGKADGIDNRHAVTTSSGTRSESGPDGYVDDYDDQDADGVINKDDDDDGSYRTGRDTNGDHKVTAEDDGQSRVNEDYEPDDDAGTLNIDVFSALADLFNWSAETTRDMYYVTINTDENSYSSISGIFQDDDGDSATTEGSTNITMTNADMQNLCKLVADGLGETQIRMPYIASVTNHWYYHNIDFLGDSLKNEETGYDAAPYGVYKKAAKAKKVINYSGKDDVTVDGETFAERYNVFLTAEFSSLTGVFYQVCEPYLNKEPSVYIKTVFNQYYYKYDGTVNTARKIAIAKALDNYTDCYSEDKRYKLDEANYEAGDVKYRWHNVKTEITREEVDEYIAAKLYEEKYREAVEANRAEIAALAEQTTQEDPITGETPEANPDEEPDEPVEQTTSLMDFNLLNSEFEVDSSDPMVRRSVDFKSNKDNSLGAFSILENIHTEEADTNYRLLKKLMVSLDYFSKEEMDTHESNILLWITNTVDGNGMDISGESIAQEIAKNGGDASGVETNGTAARDEKEYGIIVGDFRANSTIVAPGDAKIVKASDGIIELEFVTLSDEKMYPIQGQKMYLHQSNPRDPLYNVLTDYDQEPKFSAIDVLRRYRFKDEFKVFSPDDVVDFKMIIKGIEDPFEDGVVEGETIVRGQPIAKIVNTDSLNIQMTKPNKSKIENIEDYINPAYTLADEKKMAAELYYQEIGAEFGHNYDKFGRRGADVAYVAWALEQAENDEQVGYCQRHRLWKYNNMDYCWDVDCSALVWWSLKETGYDVQGDWPFSTSTERDELTRLGFVEKEFDPDNLEYGDILWKDGHTEIYCGDGKSVGAHGPTNGEPVKIDENGVEHHVYDDPPETWGGDQTGREVSVVNIPRSGYWESAFSPPAGGFGALGLAGLEDYEPDWSNLDAWGTNNALAPSNWGQCTYFAWGCSYEIYGFACWNGYGNGTDVAGQVVAQHPDKFYLSNTPVAGAIFSTPPSGVGRYPTCGHTGVVLKVNDDGSCLIFDGNYDGDTNSGMMDCVDDCGKRNYTFPSGTEFACPIL